MREGGKEGRKGSISGMRSKGVNVHCDMVLG